MADFGYHVADHTDVHPMFGTLADLREAMCDVLRFWMDRGIDGFRVDVAHRIMKDADLRDNPSDPRFRDGMAGLVDQVEAATPDVAWPSWILSNHDKPRFPTRIGRACARQALVFLLTARGTAVLYYGDELTLGLHEAAVLAPASAP